MFVIEALLNQNKKSKKKNKKKQKRVPMEENKENLPIMPRMTKFFTTLKEFQDLNMSKEEVYKQVERYLLNTKEMAANKFPCPGITKPATYCEDGLVLRKCYRCLQRFLVTFNGEYQKDERCFYHPDRNKLEKLDGEDGFVYKCCRKMIGSSGCAVFPAHIAAEPILHKAFFKSVREKRQVRTEQHFSVYALDCEMVYTGVGLEIAKIGVVNLEGLTIYETFVLPENDIIDYCTRYSGISPKDLKGVTTTLADVQTFLDQLLNADSILIGHSLEGDLKCLRLSHSKIVDTSVVFQNSNGLKRKLKDLALEHLNLIVQDDPDGHDCVEDARTSLALILNRIKKDKVFTSLTSNTVCQTPNTVSNRQFKKNAGVRNQYSFDNTFTNFCSNLPSTMSCKQTVAQTVHSSFEPYYIQNGVLWVKPQY